LLQQNFGGLLLFFLLLLMLQFDGLLPFQEELFFALIFGSFIFFRFNQLKAVFALIESVLNEILLDFVGKALV
jgi:hypothetical protein